MIPSVAISVQQPWAYLIVNRFKDVENRTWNIPARYRGQEVLIHTGSSRLFNLADVRRILGEVKRSQGDTSSIRLRDLPSTGCETGGIVGKAKLLGAIRNSRSPWAEDLPDGWHWLIGYAQPLPFMPCKGRLSFFPVDYRPAPAMAETQGRLTS